jgi:superfamily II DNA or RNA helicase
MLKSPELRDYQLAAVYAINEATSRKQLVVMPTGTGKTVVFAKKSSDDANRGRRIAILVHRDELVRQTVAKLESAGIDMEKVGVIKAFQNETDKQVTVMSVQTMARKHRSMTFAANGLVDTLIIDEAHHAPADSYRNVVDWIKKPDGLLIGFTATPDRETQKQFLKRKRNGQAIGIGVNRKSGMAKVFDQVVFYRGLTDMIAAGYLADVIPATIETKLDLDEVGISGGDWKEGELGDAMEHAQANDSIVNSWLRSDASGRKTLAFLPTIRMSIATRDSFLAAGIPAAHIDANTPIPERQEIYKKLRNGEIKVITNVMVLTEGFDEPSISAIIVARPTQSRLLFAQMIGRGTRLYPGKENVLIMSVVGHSLDLDPLTLQSFLDDPGWENDKTLSARKKELAEEVAADNEEAELQKEEAISFTQNFRIVNKAKFIWSKTSNVYNLAAGDGKHYRIVENGLVQGYRTYDLLDTDGTTLIHETDLSYALNRAEEMVRKTGNTVLVDPNQSWREKDPSAAQLWKATKLGINVPFRQVDKDHWELIPGRNSITRGELSILIDQKQLSEPATSKQQYRLRILGFGTAEKPMPKTKAEASRILTELIGN